MNLKQPEPVVELLLDHAGIDWRMKESMHASHHRHGQRSIALTSLDSPHHST